ncbi:MAG: ATP-binding protein [Acidobacteriota bacterium]|nr:ATP-binding protein [Acidobacteriota bacterium]
MFRALMAGVLVAFIIGIAILMATAPPLYLIADRATHSEREAVANACAAEIRATPERQQVRGLLDNLRGRYSLAAIEVSDRIGPTIRSGSIPTSQPFALARPAGARVVTIYFEPSPLPQVLRNFRIAAVVGTVATVAGMVLLILHLVSLARSGEAIASPATGTLGASSAYETSIRALKGHADKLQRRADELANVSATLVRSLTSGFIAIDERGLMLDMNQTARELLDIDADRAVEGLSIREALGTSEFAATLQDAIDQRKTLQRNEVVESTKSDETIIGLSTAPLVDQEGRYLGLIALFTDLTPVRFLETRVREMQSLADLGEMSAGIAHEFRNSLSTILGYLRLAQKENLGAGATDRLRHAEQEARLLTEAVESLLTFARPLSLEFQRLDASVLIREIVDRLQPLRDGIEVEFRGASAMIDGDPALLRRAFENVLRNAIEAIEQAGRPGRITVDSIETPSPRLTISDNGIGIAEEEASRLFLPFRSGKPNGFGLGLALAKKIILLHGGWIRLSGRPGSGATVTIEFPREHAEAAI